MTTHSISARATVHGTEVGMSRISTFQGGAHSVTTDGLANRFYRSRNAQSILACVIHSAVVSVVAGSAIISRGIGTDPFFAMMQRTRIAIITVIIFQAFWWGDIRVNMHIGNVRLNHYVWIHRDVRVHRNVWIEGNIGICSTFFQDIRRDHLWSHVRTLDILSSVDVLSNGPCIGRTPHPQHQQRGCQQNTHSMKLATDHPLFLLYEYHTRFRR
jgi:hypothetical protein